MKPLDVYAAMLLLDLHSTAPSCHSPTSSMPSDPPSSDPSFSTIPSIPESSKTFQQPSSMPSIEPCPKPAQQLSNDLRHRRRFYRRPRRWYWSDTFFSAFLGALFFVVTAFCGAFCEDALELLGVIVQTLSCSRPPKPPREHRKPEDILVEY
jgi:hypothetical protein